jgi:hypothetical protein
MNRRRLRTASALILGVAGLALAACGPRRTASNPATAPPPATAAPIDSLPLAQGAAAPSAPAPGPAQLAASAPIRTASAGAVREPYSYIDDAYDLGETFADSPPDYTVDYDGVRPWIWRSQGGDYRVVEQTPDGPRDYYYHAGADQPFLVRDAQYAYAYDGGALVEVYDADGRLVSPDVEAREAALAAGYFARARSLYSAAVHEQRQAAYAGDWQARRDAVLAAQRDWRADQQRNDDWRRWRDQRAQDQQARQQQAALDQERSRRQAYAAQVAGMVTGAALQHRQDQAVDQARQQQAQADARAQDEARRRQPGPPQAQHPVMAQQHPDQGAAHAPDQAHQPRIQADAARSAQAQAEAARNAAAHQQQMQADAARRAPAQVAAARNGPPAQTPPAAARDAQAHPPHMQAEAARDAQAQSQPQAPAPAPAQANDARIRAAQAQAHQQQQEATAARIQQARAAQSQAQNQAKAAQAQAQEAQAKQAQAHVQQAQADQARRVQAEAHAPPPHDPHAPPPKPESAKPDERPK